MTGGFHSVPQIDPALNRRAIRFNRPRTPNELHGYVNFVLGFRMPRTPMIAGHDSPFDYLQHSFFESESGNRDCLVWANRGGGKTQLGAIATLLDMIFKPGIQIRILGGSFEQSARMHRYLKRMLDTDVFNDLVAGHVTGRHVELTNGSRVEVLSQSERSVRGQRVHRMRCDEVELFEPGVWDAAQLVTRSGQCGDTFVRGSIEAFSTMHRPFGLMQRLVRESAAAGRRVFKWSALDGLEHCPASRRCESCGLWNDCRGRAKSITTRGFLRIDDAISQRRRIGSAVWNAEMLCESPSRSDCVYPEFDIRTHVIDAEISATNTDGQQPSPESFTRIGGIDFGMRAPTVILWAIHDGARDLVTVLDEFIVQDQTAAHVIEQVRQRKLPGDLQKDLMKTCTIPIDAVMAAAAGSAPVARPSPPEWFGVDPAGHHRNEHTGISTITLWKRAGFVIRTRSSRIDAGVQAVRARLRRADGSIGLCIHRRCDNLIEAMTKYHYPPDSIGNDDAQPVKDGPDHACDALRYMIINMDRDSSRAKGRIY